MTVTLPSVEGTTILPLIQMTRWSENEEIRRDAIQGLSSLTVSGTISSFLHDISLKCLDTLSKRIRKCIVRTQTLILVPSTPLIR